MPRRPAPLWTAGAPIVIGGVAIVLAVAVGTSAAFAWVVIALAVLLTALLVTTRR